MNKIAIFASGSGTNAQCITEYFKIHNNISVSLILSNKPDAYVIERAKKMNIPSYVFTREQFYQTEEIPDILKKNGISYIILAGFLWLIPDNLIHAYPDKIINIHPALLPKHGGKGMFGMKVHQAVVENKEKESGITIHFVNPEYDRGKIIFQQKCRVDEKDTPDDVANKVHKLEYENYPRVIEKVIMGK
jgi:phosphoribosylglycinamide formyltransferase 1